MPKLSLTAETFDGENIDEPITNGTVYLARNQLLLRNSNDAPLTAEINWVTPTTSITILVTITIMLGSMFIIKLTKK